jgi:integrase
MATKRRGDKFPLWLHPSGQWCKKHRGKPYYFGTDAADALKRFDLEWPRIITGKPRFDDRPDPTVVTVVDLVNSFLGAKEDRVNSGELTRGMWGEYYAMCDRVLESFGRSRIVAELRPDDFAKLRSATTGTLGPVALGKFITMTRTLFKYGFDSELLAAPVRFGKSFDKPSRKVLRLNKATKGAKLLSAADCCTMIDNANDQLKAMILLGLNAGFGQSDCASLPRSAIDLKAGWIIFPRPKTGIPRRAPLWPETSEALNAVLSDRRAPAEPADKELVFLTSAGNRWVRFVDRFNEDGGRKRGASIDAVAAAFSKHANRVKVTLPKGGSFYTLRHIFRTVADEVRDRPAADIIMGHADASMGGHYVEAIGDDRLRQIANHVREWLLKGKASNPAAPAGNESPEVLKFAAAG